MAVVDMVSVIKVLHTTTLYLENITLLFVLVFIFSILCLFSFSVICLPALLFLARGASNPFSTPIFLPFFPPAAASYFHHPAA